MLLVDFVVVPEEVPEVGVVEGVVVPEVVPEEVPEEVPEVVVDPDFVVVPDGLLVLETTGLDPEFIPGLITVKKMIKKTTARMSKMMPTMIPMARGLLVVQRTPNLAESPG